MIISTEDDVGDPIALTLMMKVGDEASGPERLEGYGLELLEDEGKIIVDGVTFNSAAEKAGFDFDQVITSVGVPVERPAKQWFYVPALLLLGFILLLQRRRNPLAETAAV